MTAKIRHLKELASVADWHGAAAIIEGTLEWKNEAPPTVSGLAWRTYTGLGDKSRAELWLDRALAAMPSQPTWWRGKGDYHRDRKEWCLAADCYARAIELRPDVASFHAAHGYVLGAVGDFLGAVNSLERALELNGSIRSWIIRLAQAQLRLGRLQQAADTYAEALKMGEDYRIRAIHDELRRQTFLGTCQASERYYDDVYSHSDTYAQPAERSIYLPLWERIAAVLLECGVKNILDFGCGPGQFAEFVEQNLPFAGYCGIDFSPVAVSLASSRCPRYSFERQVLPLADFADLPSFDAVICTEVLEHVEQDLDLLRSVPSGVIFIGSVPNFFSFSHLRVFQSAQHVRDRYGRFFDDFSVEGFAISSEAMLWLMRGKRKVDAASTPTKVRA